MVELVEISAEALAKRLNGSRARTKSTKKGWMALCPNHNDKNPSLSVSETQNGRILLNCFATTCRSDTAGVYRAVERHMGYEEGALGRLRRNGDAPVQHSPVKTTENDVQIIMPVPADAPPIHRKARTNKLGAPSYLWCYRDAAGAPLCHVARYDRPAKGDLPKEKIFYTWMFGIRKNKREWLVNGLPEPRVPYNLHRIVKDSSAPIFWNEGEKSADRSELIFPNWIPSTSYGGGSAQHMTDYSALAGRMVIILPDNDPAGLIYLANTVHELQKVGASIFIMRWPTAYSVENGKLVKKLYIMNEGDDIDDHINRGWTRELLQEAVRLSGYPLLWRLDEWEPQRIGSEA